MEIQQNEKDKKSKTYLMILIGALLALNIGIGINLWLGNKEKTELTTRIDTLTNDKLALQKDLDALQSDLENVRAENKSLNEQMAEKDLAIEQKINQIKLLLNKGKMTDKEFKRAKDEIAALKGQIEDYKMKIAELTQKNEELTQENLGLSQNLSAEQAKSAEKDKTIETQGQKISLAKRIHASTVNAAGVRERKVFGKKEVTTEKASRVEEIRVQFTLDKNAVADAGDKDIFVKIISPDGSPIATKAQTTTVDGTETLYTEKKTVDYQGEKMDNVVYCKKQGPFTKGEYTVEIYAEGYKVGGTKFTLK